MSAFDNKIARIRSFDAGVSQDLSGREGEKLYSKGNNIHLLVL